MQRINNLYPTCWSFQNLYGAWKKTRRGSGRTAEGALFFQELEKELLALQAELRAETWQPRPFRFFDIYDPKHRTIAVSDYRDRVVHHAVVNVLEPVFEKTFIADSYATRTGKGVHAAVYRAQHFLRRCEFFLKTDVEKFFDSIQHDRLLDILARKIKDRPLLRLCERIVRHGGSGGRGLPIGNRTSQFFANVYLDPLDHLLKDHLRTQGYVRYMDDFVLFDPDRRRLQELLRAAEDFLADKLDLRLKASATFLNRRQNGLPFLGRRIFPGIIRLHTQRLRRITRRMAVLERRHAAGDLNDAAFLQSMNSYWAMLSVYPELGPLRRTLARMPSGRGQP